MYLVALGFIAVDEGLFGFSFLGFGKELGELLLLFFFGQGRDLLGGLLKVLVLAVKNAR